MTEPRPEPNPRDAEPNAKIEPISALPASDRIDSELHVWSSGTLVAIVRRRDGQTVEVLRVAGDS